MGVDTGWNKVKADIFWGDIAFGDHVIQVYESEDVLIDTLAGFVSSGISIGDCCIIIATAAHLEALNERLENHDVCVQGLIRDNRYVPLVAEEVLSKFMVSDWPDEELFLQTISEIMERSRQSKRMIRAFGEMVAVLWARGNTKASIQLEKLWNKICERETFSLFCAYPREGFTKDNDLSVHHACTEHSKMISGSQKQLTEVYYRDKTGE